MKLPERLSPTLGSKVQSVGFPLTYSRRFGQRWNSAPGGRLFPLGRRQNSGVSLGFWHGLSHPLASVIPSMEGVVLEVLAGTHSGLGATRVHRLSYRGSRAGVSLAFDRLVAQGLVLANPTNYGYTYRLNRDHVLAGAVLAAVEARRDFLRRLTQACRSLDPEPVSVALFGSVARHESGSDSDIDLFIVVDPTLDRHAPQWLDQVDKLTQRLHAWTGNRLEPLMWTPTT